MTQLLVSVRNLPEAASALEAGADLIDVKEPSRGALGMADPAAIRQIVALVAGRVPTSAALGELGERQELPASVGSLTYAKFGLAGAAELPDWRRQLCDAIRRLPAGTRAVAVAYADWQFARAPAPAEVLQIAEQLGCAGVLVDTFDKSQGPLPDRVSRSFLAEFRAGARAAGLLMVIAGGLGLDNFSNVLELEPDYVGVRGAACSSGREGVLDSARVRSLAAAICRGRGPEHRVQSAGNC